MSRLFTSVGQSIGASASAPVFPMNIQGWFPLGLTDWIPLLIPLLIKGPSRVSSSTTVWKHQFFGAQPFLWSNCHIHTWLLEKQLLWPLLQDTGNNLSSILKSRGNTLPTKVHLVKAMVFPVVIYECESWLWRKLNTKELMLLNCGVGEDSWESLGLQGDPTSPF